MLAAALLGSGLVTTGAAAAPEPTALSAATGTTTGPDAVSVDPALSSGGLCTAEESRATKRWWMLGTNVQMDFAAKGSPAPVVGRSTGTAPEGTTVVTDTQGNLRFWANGIDVWGADGQPIKNSGGGKGMRSAAQTVVAMPAMGVPGKYYVVTTGYQAEWGPSKEQLWYSVIDMNANGGKGEMTEKNIALGAPGVAGEGLSATPNAAGDGFWVYSVAANSDKIHRWEFKADGPTSIAGQAQAMPDTFSLYSSINFDTSHGSNKAVVVSSRENIYSMVTVNRTTGVLTVGHRVQHHPVSGRGQLYGATFSPSGRYMFFSEIYGGPSHAYRVDTTAPTAAAMRDSRMDLGAMTEDRNSGGGIKLGPDGSVWVIDGFGVDSLLRVTDPDAARPSAMQRFSLAGARGGATGWALPDMVTGCERRVPRMTASVSAPSGLTLGDAVSPVTVTVTNTGNTALTGLASSSPARSTCAATTLAVGASTTCTAPAGAWGSVTKAQNDAGSVQALTHTITARGSVGADPATGLDRTATITVRPWLNLPVVTTRTLTLDAAGGSLTGPATIKRLNGAAWGTLPVPSLAHQVFLGWHTAPTGGTQVTSSTKATADLTAHAQWRAARFNVVFMPNPDIGVVTGSTPSATFDSGCTDCALPANGFAKSTGAPELVDHDEEQTEIAARFLGWSLDPDSRTGDIADRAAAGALSSTDGATVTLYAVWDDAPQFVIGAYPDREFTLGQATGGEVTEEALLSTVRAADRETNPLEHKTAAQVAASGSDVGVTLHDYDAGDYLSLTDTGAVTATYKVKDEAGHVAFLRIRVSVTDDDPLSPTSVQYLRGISPNYAGLPAEQGGFPAASLWLTDPTRQAALDKAMTGDEATTYCLDAGAVGQLRESATSGMGSSKDEGALSASASLLSESGGCS